MIKNTRKQLRIGYHGEVQIKMQQKMNKSKKKKKKMVEGELTKVGVE